MSLRPETELVRAGEAPSQHGGYLNSPVYNGSTVLYRSVAEMEAALSDPLKRSLPAYGRFGSPNVREFEAALAKLEGGHAAVCTNSGLSAITTAMLAFVSGGDHLLISDSVYLPTRSFGDSLARFGIRVEYFDPRIGGGIAEKIRPETRLVVLESPGSNTFEIQDVPAIAAACRRRGVTTMLDNTWATPLFFSPLRHGIDVSIHSATKYITGHSDSLLGAIVCGEKAYEPVRRSAIRLGQCGNSDDAYLALRGLRTLGLRLRQHQEQALALAAWLQDRREIREVLHPALSSHAGHELWKRDFRGSSGLFSVVLQPVYETSRITAMIEDLKLFGLGHSWGGVESLLVPIDPSGYRSAESWRASGALLRIHAGLENIDDLKSDLSRAFDKNL